MVSNAGTMKAGTAIVHLGMSGTLRWLDTQEPLGKHDHVEIAFGRGVLRLHDPRRFGAVLWTRRDPARHRLLSHLGPEPLEAVVVFVGVAVGLFGVLEIAAKRTPRRR